MEEIEGKERKTFVQEKAEDFAVRIVNLWKYLKQNQEYDLSRQINPEEFDSLYADASEIDRMLTSIIRTTKNNLNLNA